MYTPSAGAVCVSGVANPVLAKLYRDHGICDTAIKDLPHAERAGLCDDVAQLIEMSDRQTDREMATDILLSLLRHAEKNLKQAVAERFSVMQHAPLRVILQFINDDIDVARPVLMYSEALNDLDLLYIIQSHYAPFWQAIAARKNLGDCVVDALIDTKDILTSQTLIANESVMFSPENLEKITKLAGDHENLTEALMSRSQVAGVEFVQKIYAYAGQALKKAIVEKCGALDSETEWTLEDILSEFTGEAPSGFLPNASLLKAADLFREQGRLTSALMINTLKRGQVAAFVAQMSRITCMPVATVMAMLQQRDGHGLAIVAKAYGISSPDFLAIYTLTRKYLSQSDIVSYEITSALGYYNRVTPEVAKRLVCQSQN